MLEVIAAVKRACGQDFPVRHAPRRPGDPAALVAATDKMRQAWAGPPVTTTPSAIVVMRSDPTANRSASQSGITLAMSVARGLASHAHRSSAHRSSPTQRLT